MRMPPQTRKLAHEQPLRHLRKKFRLKERGRAFTVRETGAMEICAQLRAADALEFIAHRYQTTLKDARTMISNLAQTKSTPDRSQPWSHRPRRQRAWRSKSKKRVPLGETQWCRAASAPCCSWSR